MDRPVMLDRLDYNAVINGDFPYWQRQTSWNPTTGVTYGAPDRFGVSRNAGDAQITRSTDVPTYAQSKHFSSYSLNFSPNVAISSPTSSQNFDIVHNIEGNFLKSFIGQNIFLSFWAKSNLTGSCAISFQEGASSFNNSFVALYTLDQADTWEYKLVLLNLPDNFSWETGTGRSLRLNWTMLPEGDWNTSTPNQWVTGDKLSYSGILNFFSSTSNYLRIAQVKLGINYTGTTLADVIYSYSGKNILEEYFLCKRYYQKSYPLAIFPGATDPSGSGYHIWTQYRTGSDWQSIRLPVSMRTTPVITMYSPSNGAAGYAYQDDVAPGNIAAVGISRTEKHLEFFTGGNAGAQTRVHWVVDSEI